MTIHPSDITEQVTAEQFIAVPATRRGSDVYTLHYKRALDIFVVALFMPIVGPIILLLAAMVMLDGSSPFYSQLRVGRDGRAFRMWKLRTMIPNADIVLEEYLKSNQAARDEWDATQKLKNDPRITWFGRFLRKTSLDELPQLINVLVGDMSLVGPRPMMVCQREMYPGSAYFRMRPGITGYWQISDRNACDFRDRVRFDDRYEREMSFRTDAEVLAQTVRVVLKGTGY